MSACYPTSLSNRAYVHMELSTTSSFAALSWYGGQQAYPTYSLTVPEPPTAWWFLSRRACLRLSPNSKSRSRKQLGAKRKTLRLFNVIMSSCHPLTRLPTGFVRQTEWNPAAKTKDKGAPQLTVSGTVASLHPSAFTRYKQSMPKQSVQNCKRRHLTKNTTNYELVFCHYCDCVFLDCNDASQKIQPIPEDSSRTQGIVGVCQTSIRCRGRSWCGKCWRTVTRKMTVWHPRRWSKADGRRFGTAAEGACSRTSCMTVLLASILVWI